MTGSITRRLQMLEDNSRQQAAERIQQAWDSLSDEEIALILAPFHFNREPIPEEAIAQKESREAMPESLIAHAIGYSEKMADDEVSRRLREMLDPVLKPRRSRLLERLQSSSEAL